VDLALRTAHTARNIKLRIEVSLQLSILVVACPQHRRRSGPLSGETS
jgi:hypothetical protein